MRQEPKLAVVGSWHQACVLGASFSSMGYSVAGIAPSADLAKLTQGEAPIYEPGLDELMQLNIQAGRLRYTDDYKDGLVGVDLVFLAIDTPVSARDESDLSPIEMAADQIAAHLTGSLVLCITAQVPVGTTQRIGDRVANRRPEHKTMVAYVPEFLRLGTALESFRQADRIVIGADDDLVADQVKELYVPLGRPVHVTGVRSAEMAKHASNAFLATSISFINEIADLCEVSGCDVMEVERILKLDRRIGPHAFLSAGLGYAGGTLGREIRALHAIGVAGKVETPVLDSVDLVNSRRVGNLIKRITTVTAPIRDRKIGLLGLTYKGGTSTLRRSLGLVIADELAEGGAKVAASDPLVAESEVAGQRFVFHREPFEVARSADALVLVTPWSGLDVRQIVELGKVMSRRVIFDAGNFVSRDELTEAGFEYYGVGR